MIIIKNIKLFAAMLLAFSTFSTFTAELRQGLGGATGYGEVIMSRNDDGSSRYIDVSSIFPNGLNFFGNIYTGFYINNNGNISFNSPISSFTPIGFPVASQPMIAPYWGDVDTRGGGEEDQNNVFYFSDSNEVIITWLNVGYFSTRNNKLNSFQLILTDRSDTGSGNFDVLFLFNKIEWTTGDASGGSNGLGGIPAQVGFDAGDRQNYFAHRDSMTPEILNLPETSNIGVPGNWLFEIREGDVIEVPNELKDVYLKVYTPNSGVVIEETTFKQVPANVEVIENQKVHTWYFETFLADRIEDLSFSVILESPQPSEQRVVINGITLDYSDANSNAVHFAIGAQTVDVADTRGTISVSTDLARYSANQDVSISTEITNISDETFYGLVEVTIYDSDGALVITLDSQEFNELLPNSSLPMSFTWNTGSTMSDKYIVVAELNDAISSTSVQQVAEFEILPSQNDSDVLLSEFNVLASKRVFDTSDTMDLTFYLSNLSANSELKSGSVEILVKNNSGEKLLQESIDTSKLTPSQIIDYAINLSLVLAEGAYLVESNWISDDGELYGTNSFEIKVEQSLTSTVSANVSVLAQTIIAGDIQSCDFEIAANSGSVTEQFRFAFGSLDDSDVIIETTREITVSESEPFRFEQPINSSSLYSGGYSCSIQYQNEGKWKSLAQQSFKVELPEVTMSLEDNISPNVLLFADSSISPDAEENVNSIASVLAQKGVRLTAVYTQSEFETELYSAKYNTYFVLSDLDGLEVSTRTYLVEKVYQGHRLFSDINVIVDDKIDKELFGISPLIDEPKYSKIVGETSQFGWVNSPLFEGAQARGFNLNSAKSLLSYTLSLEGQKWGFESANQCVISDRIPALAVNYFGRGVTVYAGFNYAKLMKFNSSFELLLKDVFDFSLTSNEQIFGAHNPLYIATEVESNNITSGRVDLIGEFKDVSWVEGFVPESEGIYRSEYTLANNQSHSSGLIAIPTSQSDEMTFSLTLYQNDIDRLKALSTINQVIKVEASKITLAEFDNYLLALAVNHPTNLSLKRTRHHLVKAIEAMSDDSERYLSELLLVQIHLAKTKLADDSLKMTLSKIISSTIKARRGQ